MPLADTELLFALNPLDEKHMEAMKSLSLKGLKIPDTIVWSGVCFICSVTPTVAATLSLIYLRISRNLLLRVVKPFKSQ